MGFIRLCNCIDLVTSIGSTLASFKGFLGDMGLQRGSIRFQDGFLANWEWKRYKNAMVACSAVLINLIDPG